jgi:hypothetical protein
VKRRSLKVDVYSLKVDVYSLRGAVGRRHTPGSPPRVTLAAPYFHRRLRAFTGCASQNLPSP